MSDELDTLKSIELKIAQLVKWTRFAALQQLRNILTQNLTDDTATLIYEYSDGERSTREIAKIVGKSNATIANYWKKWSMIGIVEQSPKYLGRFQKICSLEEVGLSLPPLPKTAQDTKEQSEGS